MEEIIYDSTVQEKVLAPGDDPKPRNGRNGNDPSPRRSKKSKANGEQTNLSGGATKKRKTTAKSNSGQKTAEKKRSVDGKNKSISSDSKSNEVKTTPKKDVCAGMKSLMAQFVKRSPANSTPRSSKDANGSASSQ